MFSTVHEAIYPPDYEDARDVASRVRLDGTNEWVFSTRSFQHWSSRQCREAQEGSFGDNVMWITGSVILTHGSFGTC
jgi:hypothetical protein